MRQATIARIGRLGLFGLIILLPALLLTACASLRGSAQPILPLQTRLEAATQFKEADALQAFYAPTDGPRGGRDRREYRDMVAGIYLGAADARYEQFNAQLAREFRTTNTGSSIAVLIMNGVSVVSGQGAMRALAAGSAVVTGANASIDKNLFVDKSLQALLAAMDANRTSVKLRIRDGLRSLDAAEYSLRDVFDDIHDLEAQASVDVALQQLTTLATNDAQAKKKLLEASVQVPLLGPVLLEQVKRVRIYVETLAKAPDAASKAQLHQIAIAIGATDDPASEAKTAGNIKAWLGTHVLTQADYDHLAETLKPLTHKDAYP